MIWNITLYAFAAYGLLSAIATIVFWWPSKAKNIAPGW